MRSGRRQEERQRRRAASAARVSLLFQPTPELKITPRVAYQEVEAGGFNREEIYILYNNQFTTGGDTSRQARAISAAPREIPRQDAARRPRRELRFRSGRADLGHQLHGPRHPRQPRRLGADRLGVASTSAYPTRRGDPCRRTCATPPSSSNDPGTCACPRPAAARSSGCSAASIPTSTANMRSACRPPAMTPSPTRRWAPAPRRRSPTASRLNSPYNADLPYDIKQQRGVRRSKLRLRPVQADRRRALLQLQGKAATSFRAACSPTATPASATRPSRTAFAARDPDLRAQPQPELQRPGGQGLPPRRHQRSAQRAALLGGRPRDRSAASRVYDDETLWNYEGGVKYSGRPVTFNAAVFHTEIRDLQVTLDAGSCSSRVVFNVAQGPHPRLEAEFSVTAASLGSNCRFAGNLLNAEVRLHRARRRSPPAIGGIEKATACRPCRNSSSPRSRPTASRFNDTPNGRDWPAASISATASASRPTRKITGAASSPACPSTAPPETGATRVNLLLAAYTSSICRPASTWTTGSTRRSTPTTCSTRCPAVLRPRARPPRTARLQHRPSARDRADDPQVRFEPVEQRRRPRRPAAARRRRQRPRSAPTGRSILATDACPAPPATPPPPPVAPSSRLGIDS